MKAELREHFDSCDEAKTELFDYIEVFYNQRRRHSTLDYLSPAMYERQASRGLLIPNAAERVVHGGIVQPGPDADRSSWGIL